MKYSRAPGSPSPAEAPREPEERSSDPDRLVRRLPYGARQDEAQQASGRSGRNRDYRPATPEGHAQHPEKCDPGASRRGLEPICGGFEGGKAGFGAVSREARGQVVHAPQTAVAIEPPDKPPANSGNPAPQRTQERGGGMTAEATPATSPSRARARGPSVWSTVKLGVFSWWKGQG